MIYLTVICVVQAGIVVAMLVLHRQALNDWRDERRELLQRIQAPQVAVIDHHNRHGEVYTPPAVDTTDEGDEDFWEAKEDLAQRLAKAEAPGGGER